MNKILISLFLFSITFICFSQKNKDFSFIFLTDIHLKPENNAVTGFNKAIDSINSLPIDFIITGGDLIVDALAQNYNRTDSLYKIYNTEIKKITKPIYNCIGNHELFGIYKNDISLKTHPEYGKKIFENRIGPLYQSFNHNGWHFIILDCINITQKDTYFGNISKDQINWIKEDIKKLDTLTPIIIVSHIPFISTYNQLFKYSTKSMDSSIVVVNSKEVLQLFEKYNLKAVLQGHLHFYEDLYVNNIHFITGGSISGKWWNGAINKTEEGFVLIQIKNNELQAKYLDYKWEIKK